MRLVTYSTNGYEPPMGWALPREWDREEQDTGSAKAFLICLVPALPPPPAPFAASR